MLLSLSFLLLAVASGTSAQPISPTFKADVEAALRAPSAEQRIELLSDTVRTGTDSEVVRAIGAYFPHDLLKTARADNVCSSETSELLGIDVDLLGTAEYRRLLIDTIRCIHMAYADGIPIRD